jgi:hypothetical protein
MPTCACTCSATGAEPLRLSSPRRRTEGGGRRKGHQRHFTRGWEKWRRVPHFEEICVPCVNFWRGHELGAKSREAIELGVKFPNFAAIRRRADARDGGKKVATNFCVHFILVRSIIV